jgi:MYXO-CTERM domain-containing protein
MFPLTGRPGFRESLGDPISLSRRDLMKTSTSTVLCGITASLLVAAPSAATVVSFDFSFLSSGVQGTTVSRTDGSTGITLTFSNANGTGAQFGGDSDGVSFGFVNNGTNNTPNNFQFDMTVTGLSAGQRLLFTSYMIGYDSSNFTNSTTFSMTGGSGTSTGNSLLDIQSTALANGNWSLGLAETGTLMSVGTWPVQVSNPSNGSEFVQFEIFTFTVISSPSVPMPGAAGLAALGLAFGGRRRRDRA